MRTLRSLADIQQNLQRAVREGEQSAVLLETIVEKPPIPISERLKIYQDAYLIRMTESLKDDFVGCRALMGIEKFDWIVTDFVKSNPSRSRNLAEYSAAFPAFVGTRHPEAYEAAIKDWLAILSMRELEPESALSLNDFQSEKSIAIRLHPATILETFDETTLMAFRFEGGVSFLKLVPQEAFLAEFLSQSRSLDQLDVMIQLGHFSEDQLMATITQWIKNQIIYCSEVLK